MLRRIRQLWETLRRPSGRYSVLALLVVGAIGGVMFWGAFNWALALSNTETFCTSCHEMRDTVFQELKKTVHYSNRTGVRAICSDCHVPKEWIFKVRRKIFATRELYYKITGAVSTPEKFEAKRLEMAKEVWATMKATDSRECRNCHHFESMKLADQKPRARAQHESAQEEGQTCIDCHKGIAHKHVQEEEPEEEQDFTL